MNKSYLSHSPFLKPEEKKELELCTLRDIKKKLPPYSYKGCCRCGGVIYQWLDGDLFCGSCSRPSLKFSDN